MRGRAVWRRRLGVLFVLLTAAPLALALGCLPKEEEDPYAGLLAKGCDPTSKECSVASTAGCFDPDRAFCATFAETRDPWRSEGVSSRDYNQKELERAGLNYPGGEVCQAHYASSCGNCPTWTLETCSQVPVEALLGETKALLPEDDAPLSRQEVISRDGLTADLIGTRGDAALCVDAYQRQCSAVFASQCPSPTEAVCAEAFAQGLDDLLGEEEEGRLRDLADVGQVSNACQAWTLRSCVQQCEDQIPPDQITLEGCTAPDTSRRLVCNWYEDAQCAFRRGELCEAAYPITLERCATRRDEGDYCAPAIGQACLTQLPVLCEEAWPASLERCLNPSQVPEVCRPALEDRCRLELPSFCAAVYAPTLDRCGPDQDEVPAGCQAALEGPCEAFLDAACPERNAANCAYPDLAHPVCQEHLATRCVGWEEDLCDGDFTVASCADSSRFYELVDTLPPACAGVAIDRCEGTLMAFAQAEAEAETSCLGTLVFIPEAAGPITTEDGYSVPGRFDCRAPTIGQAQGVAAQWEGDGERVSSCEEYAYQYFYTYNRFKNAVEPFKDDARLVYDVAYSDNPAYRDFAIGYLASNSATPFRKLGGSVIGSSPGFNYLLPDPTNPRWVSSEQPYGLLPARDYANEFSVSVPRSELIYLYQVNFPLLELQTKLWHVGNPTLSSEDRSAYAAMWNALDAQIGQGARFEEYWPVRDRVFTPDSGWEFHRAMGIELTDAATRYLGRPDRPVRDAELRHFYDRRQRVKESLDNLLAARRACILEQRAISPSLSPDAIASRCELRLAPEVNTAAAEIAQATFAAWNNGCFDHYPADAQRTFHRPTPCDWAPADFVEDLRREFELAQDQLVNGCQGMLGHTFEELRGGYQYLRQSGQTVEQVRQSGDVTAAMIDFEVYLQRRQQTQLLMPAYLAQLANLPPEEQPTWGQAWSRSGEVGDRDWLAAGYQTGASWQVVPPPNNDLNRVAETNVKAEAYLDAYAFVFGDRFPILDGQARANAQERAFNAHLKLFGYNVWSGQAQVTGSAPELEPLPNLAYDWSASFSANPAYSAQDSRRIPIISVAGITVFLEIGAAGRVGLEVNARAWFESSPQTAGAALHMGVQGLVRPYADLSGFVEAGFDLIVVEVGIGGSLDMLSAELPLGLNASVRAAAGQNLANAAVQVDSEANFQLNALRGEIYYFVDYGFFGGKKKTTLHREPGILRREDLLRSSYSQSFGTVFAYCQQGLGVCAAPELAPPPPVDGIAEEEGN